MFAYVCACPCCGSTNIYVVEVTLQMNGKRRKMHSLLTDDGFTVDVRDKIDDYSTDNEVAQCDDCGTRGSLEDFGFE